MYSYSNGINSEDYECYYENYRLEEARRWLDLCVDMDAADNLKLSPNLRERWAWYLSSLEFLYDIKSWGAGHTFVNVMYEEEDKQFVEDVRKHRRKVIAKTFERARVEAFDKMIELLEMSCVMREYDARGKFSVEMFSERRGYTNYSGDGYASKLLAATHPERCCVIVGFPQDARVLPFYKEAGLIPEQCDIYIVLNPNLANETGIVAEMTASGEITDGDEWLSSCWRKGKAAAFLGYWSSYDENAPKGSPAVMRAQHTTLSKWDEANFVVMPYPQMPEKLGRLAEEMAEAEDFFNAESAHHIGMLLGKKVNSPHYHDFVEIMKAMCLDCRTPNSIEEMSRHLNENPLLCDSILIRGEWKGKDYDGVLRAWLQEHGKGDAAKFWQDKEELRDGLCWLWRNSPVHLLSSERHLAKDPFDLDETKKWLRDWSLKQGDEFDVKLKCLIEYGVPAQDIDCGKNEF